METEHGLTLYKVDQNTHNPTPYRLAEDTILAWLSFKCVATMVLAR